MRLVKPPVDHIGPRSNGMGAWPLKATLSMYTRNTGGVISELRVSTLKMPSEVANQSFPSGDRAARVPPEIVGTSGIVFAADAITQARGICRFSSDLRM